MIQASKKYMKQLAVLLPGFASTNKELDVVNDFRALMHMGPFTFFNCDNVTKYYKLEAPYIKACMALKKVDVRGNGNCLPCRFSMFIEIGNGKDVYLWTRWNEVLQFSLGVPQFWHFG